MNTVFESEIESPELVHLATASLASLQGLDKHLRQRAANRAVPF